MSWAVAVPVLCSLLAVPPLRAQSTVEDLYAVTFDKKLLVVNPVSGQCLLVATLNVEGNPSGLASAKQAHGESGGLWVVTTSRGIITSTTTMTKASCTLSAASAC